MRRRSPVVLAVLSAIALAAWLLPATATIVELVPRLHAADGADTTVYVTKTREEVPPERLQFARAQPDPDGTEGRRQAVRAVSQLRPTGPRGAGDGSRSRRLVDAQERSVSGDHEEGNAVLADRDAGRVLLAAREVNRRSAMAKPPTKGGQPWTKQDVALLRLLARQNRRTWVITQKLGRTEAAVRAKAAEEGISLKPTN